MQKSVFLKINSQAPLISAGFCPVRANVEGVIYLGEGTAQEGRGGGKSDFAL